jgi:anaerobic ribonucleoside-triphosphate reductase
MNVKKRTGEIVPFEGTKILDAVEKAFSATGYSEVAAKASAAATYSRVYRDLQVQVAPYKEVISVEEIQDYVERSLMASSPDVARVYIIYRSEHEKARVTAGRLMATLHDITHSDAKDSEVKRENANIDGNTAMGSMLKFGSESAKAYYGLKVLNPKHSKAHQNGDIHIHDLDFLTLTTTCCQIDLKTLFKGGFSTGHGHLREPNSIASYSSLAAIAIQSNQNDQHGGQSIPCFDRDMAEGVRKTYEKEFRVALSDILETLTGDDYSDAIKEMLTSMKHKGEYCVRLSGLSDKEIESLAYEIRCYIGAKLHYPDCIVSAEKRALARTDRQTYQAMEAFIHNLNTMHSRAGAQTPFSSINYGTDTSPEGRLVTKNLLLTTIAGLGNGETPIFPIQIFKIKEGVNLNPEDPNYDLYQLSLECTAKRMFPNYSFIDAPFNKQYYQEGKPETEVAYMGCRTRVMGNINDAEREQTFGRGNLSFTSINLPRLAIESHGDMNSFYSKLDGMLELAKEQLLERFEIQCQKYVRNYPFLMGQGVWLDSDKLGVNDSVREVLKHGTLSIGFIGLAETLYALTGAHHGESEVARKLGLEIVQYMRAATDKMMDETKLNFSLLATPAEGLSGRFVRMDAEKYGVIHGVTDREYYTNSFHVPVYQNISLFDKVRIEALFHELTNAGHITYVEMDGDPMQNLEALDIAVRAMHRAGIGYGAINHPLDHDPVCGFNGVIHDECPLCGRKETKDEPFERIRRITGYLVGTLDRFNTAKRAEVRDRKSHS